MTHGIMTIEILSKNNCKAMVLALTLLLTTSMQLPCCSNWANFRICRAILSLHITNTLLFTPLDYWCIKSDLYIWHTIPSLLFHRRSPGLLQGKGTATNFVLFPLDTVKCAGLGIKLSTDHLHGIPDNE